jgi:hypothetical protein
MIPKGGNQKLWIEEDGQHIGKKKKEQEKTLMGLTSHMFVPVPR